MKVFISHAFGGDDERLGSILKGDLDAAGMEGYMAEMTPKYNLLIADKIRREIEQSDWLVAIITKQGMASASVHEEIGYALGKGVEVVLMLKKDVEEAGVLVHGREPLVFASDEFEKRSLEAVDFIKKTPRPPPPRDSLGTAAQDLLEERRLLRVDSPDFAKNAHFASLYSGSLGDAGKPVVLFTACPHILDARHAVTSSEFIEWVDSNMCVEVDGRRVFTLGTEASVDIGSLLAVQKRSDASGKNIKLYREFKSNGFLEWGTSHLFFDTNDRGKTELHLCYAIGEFCAFLASTRLFYKKIELDAPFTVLFSIRNAHTLDLGNYGDDVYGNRWRLHYRASSNPAAPATNHDHIQVPHVFQSVRTMTDENIASAAKNTARDICNAYGETTPRCYSKNGSFLWNLYGQVSLRLVGGDGQ